jgi:UDP-N-acetylglucosamine transferase subunit ALG13
VLVPRRAEQCEHVDDHQREIARELAGRGLALHREVDELRGEDLVEASRRGVVRTGSPPTFRLCEP